MTSEPVGWLYRLGRWLFRQLLTGLYGLEVEGAHHLPASGGCLLACNHVAWVDPPAVGCAASHRQVYFMAKKELFRFPGVRHLLLAWGAFPVHRGNADRRAMRHALELLRQGRVVGIFPEGTRSASGGLGRGQLGVALLAARSGAPVVPAAVSNTLRLRAGGPSIRVCFGPPLVFAGEEKAGRRRLEEIRDEVMAAIGAVARRQPADPAVEARRG